MLLPRDSAWLRENLGGAAVTEESTPEFRAPRFSEASVWIRTHAGFHFGTQPSVTQEHLPSPNEGETFS
jgi:hypothetical protein